MSHGHAQHTADPLEARKLSRRSPQTVRRIRFVAATATATVAQLFAELLRDQSTADRLLITP